ncbi:hypothetical protein GCM10010210_36330 [Pseudonocardia hydrocarbonoxydans]
MRAMRAFDGCAVVTDNHLVGDTSRVAAFLMPCPVRVFARGAPAAAVEWLTGLPTIATTTQRFVEPGVVVVEVSEPLRTEDLVRLGGVVDGWLADHARGPQRAESAHRMVSTLGRPDFDATSAYGSCGRGRAGRWAGLQGAFGPWSGAGRPVRYRGARGHRAE